MPRNEKKSIHFNPSLFCPEEKTRLRNFISSQLNKHSPKPTLFVISEHHDDLQITQQEIDIIKFVAKQQDPNAQLKLFIELDSFRYWNEQIKHKGLSFFGCKSKYWGLVIEVAKENNYEVKPIDLALPMGSLLLRVVLPVLLWFVIGRLIMQCLVEPSLPASLPFVCMYVAFLTMAGYSLYNKYDKFFKPFQLAPMCSDEMMYQRDIKMTQEILSATYFNHGVLIIGCNHANRILKWLHQSDSLNIVSIALTPDYPYVVENIPDDIPVFLINKPHYNHSKTYHRYKSLVYKDPDNASPPSFLLKKRSDLTENEQSDYLKNDSSANCTTPVKVGSH